MRLSFIAPSTRHPVGGVAMIYEFAGAMAGRGHTVHLHHVPIWGPPVEGLADIGWFSFPPGVEHHFQGPQRPSLDEIPETDVIFGHAPDAQLPPHLGLPVVLVQGFQMLGKHNERPAFHAPCPKVCVASWLVDQLAELGIPRAELVHVPLGLRHERFRLRRPIARRPPRVSFCYNAHPQKGADLAIEVLGRVREQRPDLEVVFFGAAPPEHALPAWIEYRHDPSPDELVDDVYNRSRIFLCASDVEGFGFPCIEAMACGAALVTTDNGGSRDYARPGRTALVAGTGDREGLADRVVELLTDDAQRIRLAAAGREFVTRFRWDRSAEILEAFLERYVADPAAFGRPVGP